MDICVLIRKVGTVSSLSRNFDAIDMITGSREFRLNRNVGEEEREGLQGEISIRMYTLMRQGIDDQSWKHVLTLDLVCPRSRIFGLCRYKASDDRYLILSFTGQTGDDGRIYAIVSFFKNVNVVVQWFCRI